MTLSILSFLKRYWFGIATLICLIIGLAVGTVLHVFDAPHDAILWLSLPGELFLRSLHFSVIPLLACNVISVSASIDPHKQGKLALVAFGYCLIMNLISSNIGGFSTLLLQPGAYARDLADNNETLFDPLPISNVIADLFRNMVPNNFVKIFLSSVVTEISNSTTSNNQTRILYKLVETPGVNIIGLLITSLLIGLASKSSDPDTSVFVQFFSGAVKALTNLLEYILRFLPIGMGSLVLKAIAEMDGASNTAKALGMFVVTSLLYLTIIGLILLPGIYVVVNRKNPLRFFKNVSKTVLTAFSTVSSITALPDIFRFCANEDMNKQTAELLGPFLTSFNANGSAAFITSSVIFCAQLANFELSIGTAISIFCLAGINVMALPAVPSASIILVLLIVKTFSIPDTAVSLLFITEFIIDRLRTSVNVMSHCVCLMTVNRVENRMSSPILVSSNEDNNSL